MGLDYNIISNCSDANYITVNKLYKEETNVFAYYIIVAILIANFNSFKVPVERDCASSTFSFTKSLNSGCSSGAMSDQMV